MSAGLATIVNIKMSSDEMRNLFGTLAAVQALYRPLKKLETRQGLAKKTKAMCAHKEIVLPPSLDLKLSSWMR